MTDRPFRDEPTEVLETALGLADTHAQQAARFQPEQPGGELPAVASLFRAELQHREGSVTMTNPPDDERRDRYAAAIAKRDGDEWPTELEDDERNYRRRADAAMAVADAEIEHLRKERDAFRDQRNAVFATNEQLLAQVEESGLARIRAENEVRTVKREAAAPSAPAGRGAPGMYYCDDCDHAFTAPTDTESCICSCGARAWREKPADADLRDRIADGHGEPAELRDLPRELRRLVHAVDRMRSDWAESGEQRRAELWRGLHEASDAVWNRPLAALPAPADRAAVLREAADAIDASDRLRDLTDDHMLDIHAAANELRRMADEAGQAEPECSASVSGICLALVESDGPCDTGAGECVHGGKPAVEQADRVLDERVAAAKEQPVEAELRCPRCGGSLASYFSDDLVYRTGDDRPYCSGECVVAAHRADAKQQAVEPEVFGPDVVAYRNSDRPAVLLCREHGNGWMGLTPLTSDDLPDGGLCTECGVDVLIPQQQAGEGR